MKLSDLTKNLSNMTEEELLDHVKEIRNRKYIERPATKKREADAEKKEKNTAVRGVQKVLGDMTAEDKAALLKLLESDNSDGNG